MQSHKATRDVVIAEVVVWVESIVLFPSAHITIDVTIHRITNTATIATVAALAAEIPIPIRAVRVAPIKAGAERIAIVWVAVGMAWKVTPKACICWIAEVGSAGGIAWIETLPIRI